MNFKKVSEDIYHVKDVLPYDMFIKLYDEFDPYYNNWHFLKKESYDSESFPYRGQLVRHSFLSDNLVFINIGVYIKYKLMKFLNKKLKLLRVNTNIQFPGMQSSFHTDGTGNLDWTFLIFCQNNWKTIHGGEFCCQTKDNDYAYVPYIPNHGCLFDCNLEHTGNAPNSLCNIPRLSIAFSFREI